MEEEEEAACGWMNLSWQPTRAHAAEIRKDTPARIAKHANRKSHCMRGCGNPPTESPHDLARRRRPQLRAPLRRFQDRRSDASRKRVIFAATAAALSRVHVMHGAITRRQDLYVSRESNEQRKG